MCPRQAHARRLDLKKGDEVTLEFEGLGSAGYRWRERVDGDPDVVSISWRVGPAGQNKSQLCILPPLTGATTTALIGLLLSRIKEAAAPAWPSQRLERSNPMF